VKFPGPTRHRDGWALWAKRLEAGTYAFPFASSGRKEITAGELGALLEGLDLGSAKRRKRYVAPLQQKCLAP
jgi:transposase